MDTETIERKREKDSADEWLNEIRVAANSNGRKGDAIKKHLNFDVFSIPLEKLFPETALAVNDIVNTSNEGGDAVSMEIVMGTKFTCRVCGCEFKALREQHEHFKSPLHVVNLKRSLVGLRSVSHEDDINSDEDDNMDNNTDVIGEPDASLDLMKFNQEGHLSTDNTSFKEGCAKKYNDKKNGSVITFRKHSSNWEFSISNAIFSLSSSPGSQVESTDPWITLKNTLQIFHQGEKLHSCVLILQSGMFSGGIFEGNKCISHKVFRRYTVRAKAGGGQSSFDSNGRKAKSAGATLRRYGEQALKEDIQALLTSWLPFLQSSVVILTAIPNTMKHYIFSDTLHHNGFHRDDIRIRTIPFMIKKPTFEEIKIVHQKCMLIEFSFIKEFDLALKEDEEVEEEEEVRLAATTVKAGDIVVEGSDVEEEEEQEEKEVGLSPLEVVAPEEVCCMLRDLLMDLESGGGEYFNQIMKDIELSASTAAATDSSCASSEGASQYHFKSLWLSTPHSLERLETPLHVAAEGGRSREVLSLLQAGASPLVTDIRNRYPYFLAKDKDTRDAFRRYRGLQEEREQLNEQSDEGLWDWNLCGIPSGITKDMIKDKKDKEKEKKKKAKLRKQTAKQEKAEQDALNVLLKENEIANQKELEVRNYKLVGECGFCQKSLMGIVPLDIFDRRCCSSACVVMMRRRLTAEAAEKRKQSLN